jgi:hypothetical protein
MAGLADTQLGHTFVEALEESAGLADGLTGHVATPRARPSVRQLNSLSDGQLLSCGRRLDQNQNLNYFTRTKTFDIVSQGQHKQVLYQFFPVNEALSSSPGHGWK